MQSVIGALRVNLGIDTAAFSDGLETAEASLKRVGQSMQRVGQTLSLAVTAPLVAIGAKSVQAFGKQEQALAAVEAAIASTGGAAGLTADELARMAAGLQQTSTFGDEDILGKVTANLLTFSNVQGDVFARAQQAALDLSARLGTDLQSSAIQLGKALNDPVQGLTALSRVGVAFTEDQRELIRALAEGGDAAAAQGVILDELSRQYGGQAAALADTVLGKQTQAWNALGDALEAVGAVVAEVIPPIADGIKSLAEAFTNLSPETQRFVVILGGVAAAIGPALVALGLLATAVAAIGIPVAAAIAGIAALTAAVVAFWPEIRAIGETIREAIVMAMEWVAALPDAFLEMKDRVVAHVREMVEQIREWLLGRLGRIVNGVRDTTQQVGDLFRGLYDRVVGNSYVPDMVEGVETWMTRLGRSMPSVAESATDSVAQAFDNMARSAISSTASIKDALKSLGLDLLGIGARAVFTSIFSGTPIAGARAAGGPVSAGRSYLVGEQGPELFTPRASGVITPNGGGGGGVTVSNVYNFAPGVQASDLRAEGERIKRETIAAISAARRENRQFLA